MRAKRPFPMEKTRTHESRGVHSPHPLRDDPSHPHASLGEDKLQVTFAEGGVVGESTFANAQRNEAAFSSANANAKAVNFSPVADATQQASRVQSAQQAQTFARKRVIRKNPAPNKAAQQEQNLIARLSAAGRRKKAPGHAANSQQSALQRTIASTVAERDENKLHGTTKPTARSSNKRFQNQK